MNVSSDISIPVRDEKLGSERPSDLPKVTQQQKDRANAELVSWPPVAPPSCARWQTLSYQVHRPGLEGQQGLWIKYGNAGPYNGTHWEVVGPLSRAEPVSLSPPRSPSQAVR